MADWGPRWLVEERDACGVGFVADRQGRASHDLVEKALTALGCMEHRGGCSADRDSGDGAGVMTAIPWEMLNQWAGSVNVPALEPERSAVGMVFLPQHDQAAALAKSVFEQSVAEMELTLLGWRQPPVRPEVLGDQALKNLPQIEQVILTSETLNGDGLERELYLLRRHILKALRQKARIVPIHNPVFSLDRIIM